MTTAREIITDALRDINAVGVGQTPLAQNIQDGFRRLNAMLGQWRAQRWTVYHLLDLSKVATGATYYTIGSGGDFNVSVPPPKIEAAYIRQLQGTLSVDYPLTQIPTYEDYSRVPVKALQAFSSAFFYDTSWPLGKIYFWPIPNDDSYEVHIIVRDVLTSFATLNTVLNLPPEYEEALRMQLAKRLAPTYGKDLSPLYLANAKTALGMVKTSNLQIPLLEMPSGMVRQTTYNPYSDR